VDQREGWVDMFTRFQDKLFVYMRPDARQQVTKLFETYFDNLDHYQFEPKLRHGDFGPGNLIYDPNTERITGVIDFGMTELGDPAIDFAGLYTFADAAFCQRCCEIYPEIEACLDRIEFYRGTFALQEALFGIENGDEEAFEDGISPYV
ncbi:MAG: phosphotransferase, partial [Chloroflexota bacterium]